MSESRFGNYRVVEVLGSGAFSTIYKAVHEPLGRAVVVKALKTQMAPTSSFGEQLEREAKILADLAHPNVVLLLDVARAEGGRPYVVLEHVDGPSLHQVLAKRRKLSVEAALAIAMGICTGLEHVHERGVVHRDVKPSNVLCAKTGVVKLIDFGIAQRVRTASLSDTFGAEGITPSGRMAPESLKDAFGTPAYMSPEQILGDFVDGRSDLFSLGVVLYQMLSGNRPFEAPQAARSSAVNETARGGLPFGSSPRTTTLSRSSRPPASPSEHPRGAAQRIRRDAPAPLRERAPEVPRAVERIVMRLLEKSPDERYASAGAVLERLQSALRSITREDPGTIVRAALTSAGLAKADRAPREALAAARPAAISVRHSFIGFGALLVLFGLGVLGIEGTASSSMREGSRSGAEPLGLSPDRAGGLRVLATPWAHVRVDGQDVETTPFARAIPLSPGKHFVTLSHPDAPNVDREVDIVTGDTVMLDVTMSLGDDAGAPPVSGQSTLGLGAASAGTAVRDARDSRDGKDSRDVKDAGRGAR